MKKSRIMILAPILFTVTIGKAQSTDIAGFKAEKVSKTATISLNGKIEKVFPLFGAFEERKWAEGWNPALVYPATEIIEEGTTFKTPGHGHNEAQFLWRVTKYDAAVRLVQYLVSSENRDWTITVKCSPLSSSKTTAEITYAFIGLNNTGNMLNEHMLARIYEHNLKDWEDAINYYLEKGKIMPGE
jgi:hypothetical protein